MPRQSDDLQIPWKLNISATVAGKIEFMLTDPITKKPIYGSRIKLTEALFEYWLAREEGRPLPPIPTLEELRSPDARS